MNSSDPTRDGGSDDEAPGPSQRIVIANGQDLDKQYYYEVLKRIVRDWDLRKLALFGPLIRLLVAAVSIGVLLIVGIYGGLSLLEYVAGELWTAVTALVAGESLALKVLVVGVVLLFGGVTLLLLRSLLVSALDLSGLETVLNTARQLPMVALPKVWHPLNYWHAFTTNLGGRDPLIRCAAREERPVSGLYSDGPHYQNVFVDAVYLRPESERGPLRRVLHATYRWDLWSRWIPGRRWIRRFAVVVPVAVLLALGAQEVGLVDRAPLLADLPQWALLLLALPVVCVLAAMLVAIDYQVLHLEFFSDAAGLSRYRQLLNPEVVPAGLSNQSVQGPATSILGYGVFYVSRFLKSVFGTGRYRLHVRPEQLAPEDDGAGTGGDATPDESGAGGDGAPATTDGERASVAADGDAGSDDGPANDDREPSGADVGTAFPASGIDSYPDAEHAVAGATELLWSAMPSLAREPEGEPDVELALSGVDYYTVAERPESWLRRRPFGELLLGRARERRRMLVKETAGSRTGLRLPVKAVASVPDGLSADALRDRSNPEDLLFASDRWDEDELHFAFLGGGEHQQAIAKLVLALQAAGYENVDVLENAFAVGAGTGPLQSAVRKLGSGFPAPAPSGANGDEANTADNRAAAGDLGVAERAALFPVEYFVSMFDGENEFFRHEDWGFFYLRHQLDWGGEQRRYAHVLVGLSAVDTKLAYLYFEHLLNAGFQTEAPHEGTDEDVLYFFKTPAPSDYAAFEDHDVGDVGDFYLDADWESLEWSIDRYRGDERTYESVAHSSPSGGDDQPAGGRLGMEYYELDVTGVDW